MDMEATEKGVSCSRDVVTNVVIAVKYIHTYIGYRYNIGTTLRPDESVWYDQ